MNNEYQHCMISSVHVEVGFEVFYFIILNLYGTPLNEIHCGLPCGLVTMI